MEIARQTMREVHYIRDIYKRGVIRLIYTVAQGTSLQKIE